jgi:arginine decarboxylase-like protein
VAFSAQIGVLLIEAVSEVRPCLAVGLVVSAVPEVGIRAVTFANGSITMTKSSSAEAPHSSFADRRGT